jgi:hypothetical protein
MVMKLEVQGSTPTERLIHLALLALGPMADAELALVVDGNNTYLDRTLLQMRRCGIIRRGPDPDAEPCESLRDYYELLHKHRALTPGQTRSWLTPSVKNWRRLHDDMLLGYQDNGAMAGSSDSIRSVKALEDCVDHHRSKNWFTLGDELVIRALYPEFSKVASL